MKIKKETDEGSKKVRGRWNFLKEINRRKSIEGR
jgi:hypothetical protein